MFDHAPRHWTRALALVTIAALGAACWGIATGSGAGAVGPNPVTVTVTSSANPSLNGQSVTFTATVTGSAGTPTGKVTPYKNGSSQSSVTLDAQGRASWSTTFSPGTATIGATYKGSSVYAVGTSPTITQATNPDPTTTVVTSSANPSIVGASVTLTATNTAVAPGTCTIDSGTVTFYDGLTKIGTKSASSGKAAFSIKTLARGPHAITAVFPATSKCLGSTSPVMTQTVDPRPTTTTLTSTPNPSALGQSVTFTATVTSSSGTPTGTVTFADGATTLGSASLSSGHASIPAAGLSVGNHSIVASYAGANDDAASTSASRAQTVNGAVTATAISSSVNPAPTGQPVTFTASVTSGAGAPTGTVTFSDGATTLGTSPITGSTAQLTTSTLDVGAHPIVARYSGDAGFSASTSPTLTETVNGASTSTALTSDVNPSIGGSPVTFTATVASGAGTPTGTVTFSDGATALGTVTLTSGQATLTTSALGVGTHTVTAAYNGTSGFSGSTSPALTQTVAGAATSTVLVADVNPSTAGQAVTFTATVASGPGTPTGTVTFTDGATTLGASPVTAGTATLTTGTLTAGSHAVTATYQGDTVYGGSTSPTLVETVNAATSASTLFVDKANPACANTGTGVGTAAKPFCAINSAAAKATAGVTVSVAAGTYNEKVTVVSSGTASAPVTFTTAPDATVTLMGGSNGFSISGRSWVVVHGFTVTGTTGVGITVSSSTNITIDGNHVSNAGVPVSGSTATGIKLSSTTASTVSGNTTDHNSDAGVYVTTDANNNTIRNNTSFANARGYVRAAAGFDLRNSTGNVVYGNVSHDNEDSGINVWTGTTWGSNLVYDNVTYANGDHGIDVHNAVDARIISNTVYANYDSGIEMTTSVNSLLANNVSVDNGMNSIRTSGNIRADGASVTGGSTVNDDVVSLSTPGVMIDWGGVKYASLAAFRTATGQESRGVESDPRFANAAGADFHLLAGSPAIDAANTSVASEPAVDFDGTTRIDDPATVDTGIGPVTFADRGAFEYRP